MLTIWHLYWSELYKYFTRTYCVSESFWMLLMAKDCDLLLLDRSTPEIRNSVTPPPTPLPDNPSYRPSDTWRPALSWRCTRSLSAAVSVIQNYSSAICLLITAWPACIGIRQGPGHISMRYKTYLKRTSDLEPPNSDK